MWKIWNDTEKRKDWSFPSARKRHDEMLTRIGGIEEIYDKKPEKCPKCGETRLIRWGRIGSNGRSRYRCGSCGRTCCGHTGTMHYRKRLDQESMRVILDAIYAGTTIRESAGVSGLNKVTITAYRHMFLRMLSESSKNPVLKGENVQVDETYRTLPGALKDEDRKLRGISHQKTGIAIGKDGTSVVVGYLCDGHPTTGQLKSFWHDRIEIGSSLTHDSLKGYEGAFPQCPSQT